MQNKVSMLLGAAAVALGAGAGIADPFDSARPETDRTVCASGSTCDQIGTAFQNGYSDGYRDGISRRQRSDHNNGTGVKENDDQHRGAVRGSYYLISTSFIGADSLNIRP